jgi:hypothetical protein
MTSTTVNPDIIGHVTINSPTYGLFEIYLDPNVSDYLDTTIKNNRDIMSEMMRLAQLPMDNIPLKWSILDAIQFLTDQKDEAPLVKAARDQDYFR